MDDALGSDLATGASATAVADPPEFEQFLHDLDAEPGAASADDTAAVLAALDRAASGRATRVAVCGASGTGRTRLVEQARQQANRRSMRVLATHGRVGDDIPYGALLTLLYPVADHLLDLPGNERDSLVAAIELRDVDVDERAARTGLWRLLTRLAEDGPVLITADDSDLMDHATLAVLAFAVGRMDAQPIALVAATNSGAARNPLVGIADERIVLDGLDVEALVRAVHASVPATEWVVRRMVSFAGGSSAIAVDLIRSLTADQRAGRAACPQVPSPTRELVHALGPILDSLSPPARAALIAAVADTSGDIDVVRAAAQDLGATGRALAELERAGHVTIAGGSLRLRRPMLGIVAYEGLDPAERRTVHRALASAMTAPQHEAARAWHLAASTEGPDAAVAGAMAAVARSAADRGELRLAALASHRSADFSEDHAQRTRALARSLGLWTAVGDTIAMRRMLAGTGQDGVATHIARSAAARWLEGDAAGVAELRKAAPRATARERDLLDALFADAAFASGHAKEATEAAQRVVKSNAGGVARNLAEALLVLAGHAAPARLSPLDAGPSGLEDAGARDEAEAVVRSRALLRHAEAHLLYGDVDAAEASLGAPADLDGSLPWDAIWRTRLRGLLAMRQGRLATARQLLVRALGALPPAAEMARAVLREPLAETLFALGEREAAMAILDEVVPIFQGAGMARMEAAARITVGRLAWSVGEHDVAAACLERARRVDAFAPVGDLVALLTELARDQQARAWLARIDTRPDDAAAPLDVLRARASVAADPSGFQRAVDVMRRGQLVVPEAELLVDLVAWHHRRAQWGDVHRAGELAVRLLVPTGLQAWTDRLDRFEPPTPPPAGNVPAALAPLTDAERRVALAITRGLTNKEAAAELFVSVKTVDSHLQRIYPKLAVRSRAELAVLVSSAMSGAGAPSGAALGDGTGNPPDAGR